MLASATRQPPCDPSGDALLARYDHVRGATEALCAPLEVEDYVVQSMPDASPVKWHLAHTTWFFEIFVLSAARPRVAAHAPGLSALFNSYYQSVGRPFERSRRGVLSRPTVEEVFRYRHFVDDAIRTVLGDRAAAPRNTFAPVLLLGLNHEQQHQELILTDLLHAFAANPLKPAYRAAAPAEPAPAPPLKWVAFPGGLTEIGHSGTEFAFDNEMPRHPVFLQPFALASRLVTNSEYVAFIEAGGYRRPEWWLSDGWEAVQSRGWTAPLYWERNGKQWNVMTLGGVRPLEDHASVCHVSYYEADAYARWAGARLPTEAEWERAAGGQPVTGNFVESGLLTPAAAPRETHGAITQLFGDVWEWTSSAYSSYPGYRPAAGALGEYNSKFMCNQLVLRGGSCASPASHLRPTYRNFFPPDARWQFSGVRLAGDA